MGKYDSLFDEPTEPKKGKYSALFDEPSEPDSPSSSIQGIPESQPQPQEQPGLIMKGLGFVGRQVDRVSAGPIRGAEEAIQNYQPEDNGSFHPGVIGAALKGAGRGFMDPDQVQSGQQMFARMGVSNDRTPRLKQVNGNWVPGIPDAERPQDGRSQDGSIRYAGPDQGTNPSNAALLGGIQDMATPIPGLGLVKPISKGVAAGTKAVAPSVGRGMQKVAVMQAKSAIPINIPFARKGAESETFLKENLLSGGKDKAYEKSAELSKQLGNEVVGIIEQGKNEGKTVDGLALIDNLKSKFKNGPIETKEGIRILEPASQKFLDKAEKLIKRMSQDGDGRLSVKQGHAVKQWAQKQADYPGKALAQGLPLTAEADAAGLTAADLGHEFRVAVESKVPEVKDLNARLAKIIPAKQAAGWKQAVRERQELVPLKALVAVTADIAASKGAALGLLAINTAWKSGRISQTMYNLGAKLIKAGSAAEKVRIESAMEKAVSKGIISNDEIEALKSQLEPGKQPFLPSITGENELTPRSPQGRFALDKPETFVPRLGSTESPFGKPTPEAPTQFDPLEAMNPRNSQSLPQGQGSLEDMAPAEMAQSRQQAEQASREAFIRQGRERGIGLPAKPFVEPQKPSFKIVTPTEAVLPRRRPIGDIPSNFPHPYIESEAFKKVLNKTSGRRQLSLDADRIQTLKEALSRATTKEQKQELLKLLRAENNAIPLKDLAEAPVESVTPEIMKELKARLKANISKSEKQEILKILRDENYKTPLAKFK